MRHGTSWIDQWSRIHRWHDRVRTTRDEWRNDDLGTEGYRDEVFALFQSIWHLKDWLHNDPNVDVDKRDLDAWFNARDSILLVASDIANGSKHLKLDNLRAGGSAQTRNDIHLYIGRGVQMTFYVHDARTAGGEHEEVELAANCIPEWRALLEESGIPVP